MSRTEPPRITVIGLTGLPEITPGMDVAGLLVAAAEQAAGGLREGDVVALSSKVLSKSLGLRAPTGARREDLVRAESTRVVVERARADGSVGRVVEAAAGPVMLAAGVDASNTGHEPDLLLLPRDPDAAARDLREQLRQRTGVRHLGLLVTDTAGRPWRAGVTDFALGSAGLAPLEDLRGGTDADGRPLMVTVRALADELAAAADLVKGKSDGIPAALVRGCPRSWFEDDGAGARSLIRTGPGDWFRMGHVEAVRAALGAAPGTAEAMAVGIPGADRALSERIRRVIAVALLTEEDAAVDLEAAPDAFTLTVTAPDPYAVGRVTARLEVACWSEDLRCESAAAAGSATLRITPADASSVTFEGRDADEQGPRAR